MVNKLQWSITMAMKKLHVKKSQEKPDRKYTLQKK